MDERTCRILELPEILRRLGGQAQTELGRARIKALTPITREAVVASLQRDTAEAKKFLVAEHKVLWTGVGPIKRIVKRARIGGVLDAQSLLIVAKMAAGSRGIREKIDTTSAQDFPLLHAQVAKIEPSPQIEKKVFTAIGNDGTILDDASIRLKKARRSIASLQEEIQSRLQKMLRDSSLRSHLQENFVTVREGRYCLPVRADSKGQVPGIVHGRSGSGGAFFIEPQSVVDANNKLRELAAEEEAAVDEILKNLSELVREKADALDRAEDVAGELDLIFAKAQLAIAMKATAPQIGDEPLINLKAARHPMIEACVPNDIILGGSDADSCNAMLITGSNTGGKTVVLKTAGLFLLMTMCGLQIPAAAGSVVYLPKHIYADIGDEQSIEQSLSTFSSHMTQIIKVLSEAEAGDLVLFDEIGAGTDPDEGAALAKAILRNLQRRGVLLLATTHYGELKQFALSAMRFQNASVEFDQSTLKPTYRLRIGIPGASNAIEIATRLGLAKDLATRARKYLGESRRLVDQAATRLEETERSLRDEQQKAEQRAKEVAAERRQISEDESRASEQQRKLLTAAKAEAQKIVDAAEQEAQSILRELRSASKESKRTEVARGRLRTLREKNVARRDAENAEHFMGIETTTSLPEVGSLVLVQSLKKEGVLLSVSEDGSRAKVRVGSMKLDVKPGDIQRVNSKSDKSTFTGANEIRLRKAFTVPDEINLIGQSVDEAELELEKYLDDAILAETGEVRIVHGKGEGKLRKAVHALLRGHNAVSEFKVAGPQDGGDGVTIAAFGDTGLE